MPIVPGLLPITNFQQAVAFSQRCGATVPAWLHRRFAGLDRDPNARHDAAVEVAAGLVSELSAGGVDALHVYTLNRAELTRDICAAIGVAPPNSAAA